MGGPQIQLGGPQNRLGGAETPDLEEMESQYPVFLSDIKPLIQKVRKVVELFRKSPVKNAVLQGYSKESNPYYQSLQLIFDVKIHSEIVQRFSRVLISAEKALINMERRVLIVSGGGTKMA